MEVREIYKNNKKEIVAGCFVKEGKIKDNSKVRIIRHGIVIYPIQKERLLEIASLKRFKEDVKEVRSGLECGLIIRNVNDIKLGDVIEAF